jgi:polysaccharide export outer membrane protein
MRTAISSAAMAGFSVLRVCVLSVCVLSVCIPGCIAQAPPGQEPPSQEPPSQEPPKPKPPAVKPTPAQESPAPVVAPPVAAQPAVDVDPSKMAAPASNGATKPANAAPVDAASYVLGAEDLIFIAVWRSGEFSGQHMIRPDGKITINLVGEVQAAGLTPEALGTSIKERLKKVLVDPDVSVSVTQVNSKKYYIEGEVLKPGEYKLVVPTKILEALVNAGGFKDFAKQTDIRIMRNGKVLHFNYKSAIKGKTTTKNADQNVYLEAGDIIIVK